ncbi:MAG: rhamnulokinase [Planctomycetota bacterium]|jgi:rhamnulokinase
MAKKRPTKAAGRKRPRKKARKSKKGARKIAAKKKSRKAARRKRPAKKIKKRAMKTRKRAKKVKKVKKAKKRVRVPRPFQVLAIDIGASNGRAVLGSLSKDGVLTTEVIRRFRNGADDVDGLLRWDFDFLANEIREGIADTFARGHRPASVGVDTWGVDYVLLDSRGRMIDRPFAYRDHRTDGIMERFFAEVMPGEKLFGITGIQFREIDTLYQLYSDVTAHPDRLARASKMMMMPDAFAWSLTKNVNAEYTIASTSQMLDARARTWSDDVVEALGVKRSLFPDIVEPGAKAGSYRDRASKRSINVVLAAGHDTAAAVAAIPVEGDRPWAYVSSGSWSLIGVETREPVLSHAAREASVTNEGGVDGTYRFLSNVNGLWLLQECMRMWEREGAPQDIVQVCDDAARAPVHGPLVDPDHDLFKMPPNMVDAITEYCDQTGQAPPEGVGPTARCIFESLALKTRVVLERVAGLTGTAPEVIHIVGGGSRNESLCQMTADASAKPVVAGPAEGTAAGNILMQAMAAKRVGSLAELREIVRRSSELRRHEPSGSDYWQSRYERFRELLP